MPSLTRKHKKFDYVIAIPSYKRAETLRDKSLEILRVYNIDPKRIHIFVANKDEERIYTDTLDPKTYNKIIVGVAKIGPQRNFISDYYPVGKPVVEMDDDIKGFIEYVPNTKLHEKRLRSLENLIQKGFSEAKKANARV